MQREWKVTFLLTVAILALNSVCQQIIAEDIDLEKLFILDAGRFYIEKIDLEQLKVKRVKAKELDLKSFVKNYQLKGKHSIHNIKKYVSERIPQGIKSILKNFSVKLEFHYGPIYRALSDLKRRGFQKAILAYERKNLICEYAGLARKSDGSYLCFMGNVYGEDRFWHDALLLYFYFKQHNIPLRRLRLKGNLNQDKLFVKAMFFRALKKFENQNFLCAIIGYQKTLRWSLIKRKLLKHNFNLRSFPVSKVIWANAALFPDSFYNKKNINLAGKLYPDYHLPCVVYKVKTLEGMKKIISFRNIWGEATAELIELLYKMLKIKTFILFGNAGGISNCQIGSIVVPVRLYEYPSFNWFKAENIISLTNYSDVIYNAKHIRVVSPLLETSLMINNLKLQKFISIDVETTSFFKKISSFNDKAIKAGALLVITDLPGTTKTIEDKELDARLLYRVYDSVCDIIINYLKIEDIY